MYAFHDGPQICIDTPAKLNLFLELRGKRADGFHELETLMVPVSLYDRLAAAPHADSAIELDCRWVSGYEGGPLPPPADNLVYRAVDRLRHAAGIPDRGLRVQLHKRIPAEAGMGGGSSDAAAALLAANHVWQLGWSRAELANIAQELGSDVPFFLFDSLARCTGRGERIEPMQARGRLFFVIVKPAIGLSTAKVFKHSQIPTDPRSGIPLFTALQNWNVRSIASHMYNRLQAAAMELTPWVDTAARAMQQAGVCGHQMSGSGTSYFGLCHHRDHARRVAATLSTFGLGHVFVVNTVGL